MNIARNDFEKREGDASLNLGIGVGGKAGLPGFPSRLKVASADGPRARPEPVVVGAATKAGLPGSRMRQ